VEEIVNQILPRRVARAAAAIGRSNVAGTAAGWLPEKRRMVLVIAAVRLHFSTSYFPKFFPAEGDANKCIQKAKTAPPDRLLRFVGGDVDVGRGCGFGEGAG
jgi:hypothetical protein